MSDNEDNQRTFLLLQVDLSNHTIWLKEKVQEKHFAKKGLAKKVIDELKCNYEFDKLFWMGDGGLFVSKAEDRADYDIVVDASDRVYTVFEEWTTDYKELDTHQLCIRVSADVAEIFTDEDPSFWTSPNLNLFIKYERKISDRGFAISQQIKDKLTAQKKERFAYNRWIGRENPMKIWYDSIHESKEMSQP